MVHDTTGIYERKALLWLVEMADHHARSRERQTMSTKVPRRNVTRLEIDLLARATEDASVLRDHTGLVERALSHRNCFVRRLGVECLPVTRPRGFQRELIRALSDRCWEVRMAGAEGLEAITTRKRRSPPELIALLKDQSPLVRLQAAEALGYMREHVGRG
jgi:HEAT repeat protein